MTEETYILCVSNAYQKKYYLNPEFEGLPEGVKEELKIMCVLFTEDVGGILSLVFSEDGTLNLITSADDGDLLYDEIGSVLKIKQIRSTKKELLEGLELYFRVFYLGEAFPDEEAAW